MMRHATARWGIVAVLALSACKKKGKPEAAPDVVPETTEATSASPGADVSGSALQRVERAARLIEGGDEPSLIKAGVILDNVTQEDPAFAMAWYDLGVVRQRLGALQDAADAFTRATRADPDLPQGWHGLGVAEQQLGDPALAIAHFDKGIAVAPDFVDNHIGKIAALRALGRPDQAVNAAKAALQINARSLAVYNLMGLAYLDLNELDLARFVYEKAETVPGADEDATIQANFGWTLYRKGERYPAEVRLKRAVKLDGDFVPGLVYLARLYLEDHNYADTVPLLETAVARAPDAHGAWMNLGIAYRGMGRMPEAQSAWERALALVPTDPSPLFNLGILLGDDLKDYAGSIARFQAYIDAGGADAERALTYIDKVEREQKKAERQRAKEEDKARKAAERAERERLLEKAKKEAPAEASPWTTDAGQTAAPAPAPEPEPAPAPEPAPSPWDTTGGEAP